MKKKKKRQIACVFCGKVVTMSISAEGLDMTEGITNYTERELKRWQRFHCKHLIKNL